MPKVQYQNHEEIIREKVAYLEQIQHVIEWLSGRKKQIEADKNANELEIEDKKKDGKEPSEWDINYLNQSIATLKAINKIMDELLEKI